MTQIRLVAYEHDAVDGGLARAIQRRNEQDPHNVAVGVIPELLEPTGYVDVGLVLCDIVDEESSYGAAVVGARDCSVALLTGCIPDLRLDGLVVDGDGSCCKLDANCGFRLEIELVPGETREDW